MRSRSKTYVFKDIALPTLANIKHHALTIDDRQRNIIKLHLNIVKLHLNSNKLHLNIIKLHLNIIKLHLKIIKLHLKLLIMIKLHLRWLPTVILTGTGD